MARRTLLSSMGVPARVQKSQGGPRLPAQEWCLAHAVVLELT